MIAGGATVVDLAAYLGVTPARVRQIVREQNIQPVGQCWKAKLYPPRPVIEAGTRAKRNRSGSLTLNGMTHAQAQHSHT